MSRQQKVNGLTLGIDSAVQISILSSNLDVRVRNNVAKISLDFSATIPREQLQIALQQMDSCFANPTAERCHGKPSDSHPSRRG